MAYCSKCGTLNSDEAAVCTNCGAVLQGTQKQESPVVRTWQWQDYRGYPWRSGALIVLAIGIIIIIIGVVALTAEAYDIVIPWGALFLIFIGLLIITAGIRSRYLWRRRS